jgi:dihydroorotate dehydrogenase
MYRYLLRPLFFSMQPEQAHDIMRVVGRVANIPLVSNVFSRCSHIPDPRLAVEVAGMRFQNPIGMAAGLDKDSELLGLWNAIGFGHAELGGVTAKAQPGNPKPRIFRLKADEALINRVGFPSGGADCVAERLAILRKRLPCLPPLGMNIGKSKVTELDQALEDYAYSFSKIAKFVDYVAINVSSPNTPGLRQLQERDRLLGLLQGLQAINTEAKPLFVKVAPDLTFEALDEVLECCFASKVSGIIATNTWLARPELRTVTDEAGGLSGAPLRKRALEVVSFIGSRLRSQGQPRMALIGVGGISSYQDVLAMLGAGADLVQLYTSLIYEGPGLVKRLNRDLVRFMDEHRCTSLQEAAELWVSEHGSAQAA